MDHTSQSITATKQKVSFWLALGVCLLTGAFAFAEPTIKVIERPYKVSATTAQGLVAQMSVGGPIGFWAFTRTSVAWRGQCEVRVKIRYSMPVHSNPEQMSPELRRKWNRMIKAMRRHEEQHGRHAINAAREIEGANCVNGNAILRKWRGQDKAYDARTDHGKTEGVFLQ